MTNGSIRPLRKLGDRLKQSRTLAISVWCNHTPALPQMSPDAWLAVSALSVAASLQAGHEQVTGLT